MPSIVSKSFSKFLVLSQAISRKVHDSFLIFFLQMKIISVPIDTQEIRLSKSNGTSCRPLNYVGLFSHFGVFLPVITTDIFDSFPQFFITT